MGMTPPLLMGWKKVIYSICSHALEFRWVKLPPPPLASGKDKSRLQHLESCTIVWVGKTPPLLMGRSKDVCNICSHTLEIGSVRLPLSDEQDKSCLQHLELCTEDWEGKTSPLLLGRRKVICNIWSYELEFGWVRLPLSNGQEKSCLQHLQSCN